MATPGGRNLLMRTSRCAEKAAEIYPQFLQMLNDANVPELDRGIVLYMLAQVLPFTDEQAQVLN